MNPDNQNNPAPDMPEGDDGKMQMPPDGQNPSPMVGGPEKSKKMMWLWIIIILFVLLALFLGWWWWKDKDKKDAAATTTESSEQQAKAEEVTCTDGLTEYTNTDLGIGFCYPTEWGEVTVADAKFAVADTGERWIVKFADKTMVNLGLVSADWSTEVARDGTCVDPAVQTLPAFSPFSTTWTTEGTPVTSANRGIEVLADKYLIHEEVDDLLTNGVCVHGYVITEGDPFSHATASYSAEFAAPVTTPQQHIDSPETLISEANRDAFYAFVKSVHKL